MTALKAERALQRRIDLGAMEREALERIKARDAADLAIVVECAREHLRDEGGVTASTIAETAAASLDWPGQVLVPWRRVELNTRHALRRLARRALDTLAAAGECKPVRSGRYRQELVWVPADEPVPVHDGDTLGGWIAQTLAIEVRTRREERGWTQAALAARMSVEREHVARDEAGRHVMSLRRATEYAAAFGVSLRDFLLVVDQAPRELLEMG